MNTTKQFLSKADYASPLCKTIAVNINNSLLAGSEYFGEEGEAGKRVEWNTYGDF